MQLSVEEQAEQDNVQLLAAMMGGNDDDIEVYRKVLRKHNGSIEKAADAILQGDRGDDVWLALPPAQSTGRTVSPTQAPPAPSARVIDLTEDDDMSRALQLSMETSQSEVRFGPSERAPDPSWQLVPSNLNVEPEGAQAQEDQQMKEAIQASLKDFPAEEPDVVPFEDTIREGGRPVALRSETLELVYAALIFHALFHVPQVREQVAIMPLPSVEPDEPKDSFARAIVNIIEYFSNLDLAQLSAIVDRDLLASLQAPLMDRAMDRVADVSAEFLRSIAVLISKHLDDHAEENEQPSRLFFFHHGNVEYRMNLPRRIKRSNPDLGFVVVVDVGMENIPNDLVGALSANLSRYTDSGSAHDVIIEPSDVLAFHLVHKRHPNSRSSLDTFVYPKTLYLDRFLSKSLELVIQKKSQEQDMNAKIERLTERKEILSRHDNRDTLADLRSTLYYYEHVASAADPERERQIGETTTKLKSILVAITEQLNAIDREIEKLRLEVTTLFDCPELQQYRYDLRAVLVHTGLPGRKQLYSYVQDVEGTWWKTVDFTVTEVTEETVLTDPNGLHLGAGPYLLLYSRHMPQERIKMPMPWPVEFVESVEQSNQTFLKMIPPELAAKAKTSSSISSSEETIMA